MIPGRTHKDCSNQYEQCLRLPLYDRSLNLVMKSETGISQEIPEELRIKLNKLNIMPITDTELTMAKTGELEDNKQIKETNEKAGLQSERKGKLINYSSDISTKELI